MKMLFVALLVLAASVSGAQAQSSNAADVRAEVAAAMYYNSSVVEALEREHSIEVQGLRQRVGDLEQRVEAGESTLRGELADLQERLVRELADRDATLARVVAAFRSDVENIAATPLGLNALRLYNEGDWVGANAIFEDIIAAVDRAEALASAIRRAVPRRQRATLALQSRRLGLVSTQELIRYYEEVTRLDPGVHWDWVELARLYEDAGRSADELEAAQHAASSASNLREQIVAIDSVGQQLLRQGDLTGARAAFERSVALGTDRLRTDSDFVEVALDLSTSEDLLGDTLLESGELDAALARYEHGLALREDVALRVQNHPWVQRDISVSHNKIGDVALAQGQVDEAVEHYSMSLRVRRQLLENDVTSLDLRRDVGVALERLGNAYLSRGDLERAEENYLEGIGIRQDLVRRDPSSANMQRDLGMLYLHLGDLNIQRLRPSRAAEYFQHAVTIMRDLVGRNSENVMFRRDLATALRSTGDIQVSNGQEEGIELLRESVMEADAVVS